MNTTIQLRISEKTKRQAKKVLENVGLDISSGVKIFLEHVIINKGVPFAPSTHKWTDLRHWKLYEKEIAWAKKYGKRYSSAEEMHADILKGVK